MVYWVAFSFGVMDSATSFFALPLSSKDTRREKTRSMTTPPAVSLVLPGTSGFCGSESPAVMIILPSLAALLEALLDAPQPLSIMTTAEAAATRAKACFFMKVS